MHQPILGQLPRGFLARVSPRKRSTQRWCLTVVATARVAITAIVVTMRSNLAVLASLPLLEVCVPFARHSQLAQSHQCFANLQLH